ncbi:MAG: response regulator transcription factor [Burkholderiaceae bacterium]|nr:response regulator transcription factor [Burkholderiaceae bacterium]MDO9089258.1 response regulator transcription factor [Burkholderiaceae bacterium]
MHFTAPDILILEDHPMMVSSMLTCLQYLRPPAKIACAGTLTLARRLVAERGPPRVVIVDLNLPDSSGLATLLAIMSIAPAAGLVVFTALEDAATIQTARMLGAKCVLAKSSLAGDFVQEVQECLQTCATHPDPQPGAPSSDAALFAALTQRQRSVLQRIARGHSNREIASQLCISESTVRTHVTEILQRLDAPNRTRACARYLSWALEHGVAI